MLVIAFFSWWYTAGWTLAARRGLARIAGVIDFFSIGLLLRSLFAPFRQISVGRVQGPLDVQIRAWADRQISRAIGAIVRFVVILFGLLATIMATIVAVALLLLWPLVPFVPLIVIGITLGVR